MSKRHWQGGGGDEGHGSGRSEPICSDSANRSQFKHDASCALHPVRTVALSIEDGSIDDGEICKNLADREGKTRDEESVLSSIQLTKPKNHTSCPNGPRQSQLTKHQLQLTKPVGEKIPGFSRYTQNPYLNTRGTLHRSVLLGYKENQQKVQWTGKATSRHTSNTKHKHMGINAIAPLERRACWDA